MWPSRILVWENVSINGDFFFFFFFFFLFVLFVFVFMEEGALKAKVPRAMKVLMQPWDLGGHSVSPGWSLGSFGLPGTMNKTHSWSHSLPSNLFYQCLSHQSKWQHLTCCYSGHKPCISHTRMDSISKVCPFYLWNTQSMATPPASRSTSWIWAPLIFHLEPAIAT